MFVILKDLLKRDKKFLFGFIVVCILVFLAILSIFSPYDPRSWSVVPLSLIHICIYWSDGVPFTADDVVFTVKNIQSHPGMGSQPQLQEYVKDIYKADDYTCLLYTSFLRMQHI